MQKPISTPLHAPIPAEHFGNRSVHIIDLSPARAAAGPLWNELSEAVCGKFEAIIHARMTPDCYFEKLDETRYLAVTPHLQGDSGTVFVIRLAREFEAALYGTCALDRVQIEIAEPDGAENIKGQPIRAEILARLADKAQSEELHSSEGRRRSKRVPAGESATAPPERIRRSAVSVTHRFEPIWDVRHQVISTYLCVPEAIFCEDAPSEMLRMKDLTLRERITVELACLKRGVGQLSKLQKDGERFLLGIPLSFETLCAPVGRTEFVLTCRGLPGTYRQYLMFLLTDVPLGVTQSRLADLAMTLRPFGHIVAGVASGCRNFNAYFGSGISGIFLDASKETNAPTKIGDDITRLGNASRMSYLPAMILNVEDTRTLGLATAADFRLLHGRVVGPPLQAPRGMARLPTDAVLQEALGAGSEAWL
ncbi:MAG: hypothetical protein WDN03_12935 [Rhizomicrobium sp.]